MKKFTIVVSMVALVGALITPTSANAALRVPKTSWPVCTTAAQDFWGSAVQASTGRVFVSTNWKAGSGASTIEWLNSNL